MPEAQYLKGLNPEQRAAVEHVEGPLLVLAGAGSGKTRVLTTRIVHLIHEHGVDPGGVLAVTFTNKAAAEMRTRIGRLLGREPTGMWIGTFHALGARLLRRHAALLGWSSNFSIYDAEQALREIKRIFERLNLSMKQWSPKAVHAAISSAKNQLVDPETYDGLARDAFSRVVAGIYPKYQEALRSQNAFDFDDLLVQPVRLLDENAPLLAKYRERFQFLLVDEYQDTNRAQYRFIELLAREHENLMVVGDDDQSIYGWRGADIRNILDFEKAFPSARLIRLEQNYRSTGRILEAANRAIAENVQRKGKTLRTNAGPGERLTRVDALDEADEAAWIAAEVEALRAAGSPEFSLRHIAILYRTNAQSRALEDALRRRDIPYQVVGGTRFYERREIMDVLAYLRLISNPQDGGAFDRIVNVPRRGIGDVSRAKIMEWAAAEGMPVVEAARRARECPAVSGAAAKALAAFGDAVERFRGLAATAPVGDLIERLVAEFGIMEALLEEGPEGEDRVENVKELIASAHEFDAALDAVVDEPDEDPLSPLDLFLQKVSLIADVDRHDPRANALTLMTLHNAKGLEFPVVFLSGLEDGLFPLARAFDEPDTLEEERRLFYVGLTRAQRKVYLTHARSRRRGAEVLPCKPSSFLDPIPRELVDERMTPAAARMPRYRDAAVSRSASFGESARFGRYDRSGSGDGLRRAPVPDLDLPDAGDVTRFVTGERVRHPQFGTGTIRELSGFGRDLKAVIDFPQIGRKKIMVRYANLQKVS